MQDRALEKRLAELLFQLTFGPTLLDRHAQVKRTLFRSLGLRQDDEIVGPWQLCHQRCHFLVLGVGLVELTHSKEISAGEAPQPWQCDGEMLRQVVYNSFAPLRGFELRADVLADLPVQTNEFPVDR